MKTLTWNGSATEGYTLSDSSATMRKEGKAWILYYAGQAHTLPRKPTFDHAEAIIARLQGLS